MEDVRFYLSLLQRRLVWFALAVAACTAAGIGLAVTRPPVYEAGARLVVEAEKIPDELAASTVQTHAYAHLEIIEQRLMSRDTLLDLASRLAIYGAERPAPDAVVRDLRSRIGYAIEGEPNPSRAGGTATMLSLSYEDRDPVLAAAVTNELVNLVLAEDVDMRTSVARQTLEFFEQEVTRLQQELSESSARLTEFRQEQGHALPAATGAGHQRALALESELTRLERDAEELTRERTRMVRLHETIDRREGRVAGRSPGDEADALYESRQLGALRETLSELPAGDPGAADIETRIAALERRQAARTADAEESGSAYDRRLAEIDARLNAGDARRLELMDELAALRMDLESAPAAAAELAGLEQDHATLRTLYDQAVEAKAAAETGDAIEALSKGQRIAIIEQATVPRDPASPNRKLVAVGGVGAGLVLGFLIVVLLELRLGFLRRPKDLQNRLGIMPIATLPVIDIDLPAPRGA